MESRSYCKKCRLKKCFSVGMKRDLILSKCRVVGVLPSALVNRNMCRNVKTLSTKQDTIKLDLLNDNTCRHVMTYKLKPHVATPIPLSTRVLVLLTIQLFIEQHQLRVAHCRIPQHHIDGLMQDCSNSSALAMELLQSCTKPAISSQYGTKTMT